MRGRHSTVIISMTPQTREQLHRWTHRQKTPAGLASRARAMLLLEQGFTFVRTARYVGLTECNLRKWARRFHKQGTAGLFEKARSGRPPLFPAEVALHVVKLACERPDDTRTGKVYAHTELRKRQQEFIALLIQLDQEIPPSIRHIFLVLDNLSVHKGKQVQAWLQSHPRFTFFFVPVHCSWMNQVEQWFSILQRKRLRISDVRGSRSPFRAAHDVCC
jgi:transposase